MGLNFRNPANHDSIEVVKSVFNGFNFEAGHCQAFGQLRGLQIKRNVCF
jgi:hypothetical protein